MANSGRGFWLHQFVEYFIAGGLVMMSAQLKEPAIPAAMGLIMLVNTAITDGLFSAFKWISRGVHRVIDWLIIIAWNQLCEAWCANRASSLGCGHGLHNTSTRS
jgi:hypothetical protein